MNLAASGATLDLNGLNQTIASLTGVTGSRLVLGSARTPTYAPTADGVAQITDLGAEDRLQLGMLRDFLDEGDPCRDALGRVLRT